MRGGPQTSIASFCHLPAKRRDVRPAVDRRLQVRRGGLGAPLPGCRRDDRSVGNVAGFAIDHPHLADAQCLSHGGLNVLEHGMSDGVLLLLLFVEEVPHRGPDRPRDRRLILGVLAKPGEPFSFLSVEHGRETVTQQVVERFLLSPGAAGVAPVRRPPVPDAATAHLLAEEFPEGIEDGVPRRRPWARLSGHSPRTVLDAS